MKPVGFLTSLGSKSTATDLKVDSDGKVIQPWHRFNHGSPGRRREAESLGGAGLYSQAFHHGMPVYTWYQPNHQCLKNPNYLTKWLEEQGFRLQVYSQDHNKNAKRNPRLLFITPQAVIEVYTEPASKHQKDLIVYMMLITTDKCLYDSFIDCIPKLLASPPTKGSLKMLVQAGPDKPVQVRDAGSVDAPLDRANYMPDVVEGFEHVVKEMKKKRPRGRITVLNGPPGTGKTFLMRALVTEVPNAMFVVVPPSKVSQIGDPEFVNALIESRHSADTSIILLLEDADEVLSTRSTTNVSSISNVLNLGDGLYGEAMDIRIVATTNVEKENLDPAVMRPGRLCRHIEVGGLSGEQARKVYEKLLPNADTLGLFPDGATLAEVYGAAQDQGYDPDASDEEAAPNGGADPSDEGLTDAQRTLIAENMARAERLGFPPEWFKDLPTEQPAPTDKQSEQQATRPRSTREERMAVLGRIAADMNKRYPGLNLK